MRALRLPLTLLPALLLALLVSSQLLTDRIGWLQWLWWIPRLAFALPVVLGFALLWALECWFWKGAAVERRRAAIWFGAASLLSLACIWPDVGLPRGRPDGALRLVFWNACYPERDQARDAVDFVLGLDADVVVMTDAGLMMSDGGAARLETAGYRIARPGSFTVLSRAGIREARPIYAARGRALSRIDLETDRGPLAIDAVDLPSETTLHRYMVVRSFVGELEGLRNDDADLVVGDFNITRGSASLSLLAPGARDAFATAGTGWGATYPRARPLVAIDQVLVRGPWFAARAEVVDPGFGRHRAVVADLDRARE